MKFAINKGYTVQKGGMPLLLLTKRDVQRIVSMEEVIAIVEQAFIAYSNGESVVPARTQIPISHENAVALYMPGYVKNLEALGIKIVSVFPNNLERDMATISSVVIMNDAVTGEPIAAMEGSYLTAMRTGAASGVATKYLAREDADTIAIIGTGIQARTQLEAVCCVRDIKKVKVFDIDKSRAQKYMDDMKNANIARTISFEIAETSEEAIKEADIICTTTTSKKPVFSANGLKIGVHINAVGAFTPEMQEIGEDVLKKTSKMCVDSIEAALEEVGDFIIPIRKGLMMPADLYGEIGQIASGSRPGRENQEEITLFKTSGIAVQDVSVGKYILEKAKELGLGQQFDFMDNSEFR
jgi:alanine dehydrogenase